MPWHRSQRISGNKYSTNQGTLPLPAADRPSLMPTLESVELESVDPLLPELPDAGVEEDPEEPEAAEESVDVPLVSLEEDVLLPNVAEPLRNLNG